jgi:hypothetical protein
MRRICYGWHIDTSFRFLGTFHITFLPFIVAKAEWANNIIEEHNILSTMKILFTKLLNVFYYTTFILYVLTIISNHSVNCIQELNDTFVKRELNTGQKGNVAG